MYLYRAYSNNIAHTFHSTDIWSIIGPLMGPVSTGPSIERLAQARTHCPHGLRRLSLYVHPTINRKTPFLTPEFDTIVSYKAMDIHKLYVRLHIHI